MSQVRKDVLNGWKEIASYIGRDIRTVERWEKQRGLPIRRVPGEGRATVYAVVSEVERWFTSANPEEASDGYANGVGSASSGSAISVVVHTNGATPALDLNGSATQDLASHPRQTTAETLPERHRHYWAMAVVVTLALSASAIFTWRRLHRAPAQAVSTYSFDANRTTPGVPYPSRVPGVDELYLRAVYFYEQRTPSSMQHAEEYFSQAIARDPNYAPAYAGLSNTYNLYREYAAMPDAVAYPKAKQAAERAIALDPRLPQAHVSLGFIDFFWSGDAVGAEREFRTAIALDPSLVIAHHWYGSVLTHEGRYPEALAQLDIAQHLQPTSAAVLSSRALALGLSGHRSEAVAMLKEQLNEGPQTTSPHQMLAILGLVEPRDIPLCLHEARVVATMRNDLSQLRTLDVADAAYRGGGEPAMWKALYLNEQRTHPASQLPTFDMGAEQAMLGNFDAAFAILTPYAKRRDHKALAMNIDPRLVELRKDPRYATLYAYTGVPDAMKIQ